MRNTPTPSVFGDRTSRIVRGGWCASTIPGFYAGRGSPLVADGRLALGRQVVPAAGEVEPRVVDQRPELLQGHPQRLGELVAVGRAVPGEVVRDPPPLGHRVRHTRLLVPGPRRSPRSAAQRRPPLVEPLALDRLDFLGANAVPSGD